MFLKLSFAVSRSVLYIYIYIHSIYIYIHIYIHRIYVYILGGTKL